MSRRFLPVVSAALPVVSAVLVSAALLLCSSTARAESVEEPSTGYKFEAVRNVEGRPYALVGVGVRKKFVVKVYAMALYIDEAEGRHAFPALVSRAGGHDHAKLTSSDHAQSFVLWGTFGKLGVLHFVRSVDAGKIRGAFEEGLEEELSDKAPADIKQGAQAFLALFDKDLKDGQDIVLRTTADGKIDVDVAGVKKSGPQSPRLARAVWSIWLGQKPISADLRRGLVERIDVLGKP
jgi:chalcone isomerase-like protein